MGGKSRNEPGRPLDRLITSGTFESITASLSGENVPGPCLGANVDYREVRGPDVAGRLKNRGPVPGE